MSKRFPIAIAAVLLVAACVEPSAPRTCTDNDVPVSERPDLPVERRTEHLDIYGDGVPICAGSALEYERHVSFVASQLGLSDIRTGIPIYVYADWTPEPCKGDGGCTKVDGVVHGNVATIPHEL